MNAIAQFDSTVLDRLTNVEAEQGVLGSVLLNNRTLGALSFLKPEHFSEPVHAAIYTAVVARRTAGEMASVLTIVSDLPAFTVGDMGPSAYLAHLAASSWTVTETIASTAREIVALAVKRRLHGLGEGLQTAAAAPGMKASELIGSTEIELVRLADEIGRLNPQREIDGADVLTEIRDRMESGRHYKGVECGLAAIDNRLGGFAPGELIVVAGRPGMGKTAFGLSLARRAAHVGVGVGFDTVEMTKTALWHRLLSDEALVDETIAYKEIGRGRLTAAQFETIWRANDRLEELPLVVIDRGNKLSDVAGHIRHARKALEKRGKTLSLFVVDYLGLLQPSDRYAGQRVNEVGEISSTLKSLAKREGLAIIALHQLNRANESRSEDHRPRLSDLRDSGNLEQDADVVMFVYRDAYYIERPGYRTFASEGEKSAALLDCTMKMEVVIAKQRQGEIATETLWCDMSTNSVRDGERR